MGMSFEARKFVLPELEETRDFEVYVADNLDEALSHLKYYRELKGGGKWAPGPSKTAYFRTLIGPDLTTVWIIVKEWTIRLRQILRKEKLVWVEKE